jgi:hypothetical protein
MGIFLEFDMFSSLWSIRIGLRMEDARGSPASVDEDSFPRESRITPIALPDSGRRLVLIDSRPAVSGAVGIGGMRAGARFQEDIASRIRIVIGDPSVRNEDWRRILTRTSAYLPSRPGDRTHDSSDSFGPISRRSAASKNDASVSGSCADAASCLV